jgi:hypothetical protein
VVGGKDCLSPNEIIESLLGVVQTCIPESVCSPAFLPLPPNLWLHKPSAGKMLFCKVRGLMTPCLLVTLNVVPLQSA